MGEGTATGSATAAQRKRTATANRRPTLMLAIAAVLVAAGCAINPVAPVGTAVDVAATGVTTTAKVAGTVATTGAKVVTAPVRALFAPGDMQTFNPNLMDAPPLSEAEMQCRRELERLKVQFTPVPDVSGAMGCGIRNPVRVTALSKRIALKPAAVMNCQAALAAAKWAHRDLAPAARRRYASNVREIRHMSAYSCRRIRGSGTLSEHGKGNALDIGAIRLANGHMIKVRKPGFFSFREKSFLKSIRKGACRHFTTVLGPGSDRDHADHFHFDLKARRNGGTYCDL